MSIATVQQRLKNSGHYTGKVNGLWDVATERGVVEAMDRAGFAPLASPVTVPVAPPPSVTRPAYTIAMFVEHFIETYEGGLSMDPKDTGNWYRGVLCGSKYGVTAAALADYRGVRDIKPADVANLSEAEAVQIGVELYYDRPDFDLLPWNPVVASIMDMGWGAGPGQSIKLWQRQIGASDDGKLGRYTVQASEDYFVNVGLEAAAVAWCNTRYAFYEKIIAVRPTNAKYRNGWRRRSAGFLPGTEFWKAWNLPASNRSAA